MLGLSWALFLSAMMTGIVVTAPLADQVFHKGAVGYGSLNGGWGVGAFASAFYAPVLIKKFGARRAMAISLAVLAVLMTAAPLAPVLMIAVAAYAIMGSGRGVTGVAMNTSLMEQIPPHFMGRVQNTFYAAGTTLQVLQSYLVGAVAQWNLVAGFSVIGIVYAIGFVSAMWPVRTAQPAEIASAE
jgi:MFS family permease